MLDRKRKIEDLVEDFHALHQKMTKMGQELTAKLQVTFTEMIVLRIVKEHDGIGIKELANIMAISSSAATQQVDSLVRKGYLLRAQGERDRRSLQISLSPQMTQKTGLLKRQGIGKLNSVFAALNDEEFLTYCALSKKIASQILER